ncbi:MAG: hypothetical protein F6K35_39720, partial [Okeania sp. SIO2H7]|nr:hypothetical protein [Okeania sp. SIO2H7]
GIVADRTGIIVDRTGIVVDRTGIVADRTGIVADRTGIVADRTGIVVDRSDFRKVENQLRQLLPIPNSPFPKIDYNGFFTQKKPWLLLSLAQLN